MVLKNLPSAFAAPTLVPMSDKAKFWALLDHFPARVREMWDKDREEHLGQGSGFSRGEAVMHDALKAIWYGKGEVELADLANLDPQFKQPLIEWLADPFWP